ncbi:hypothetical protein GCM10009856_58830 [Mycolicibacterium llatzerense]
MLVAQQQLGGGLHFPQRVAVHSGDRRGPHPPLVGKKKLEATHVLTVAAAEYGSDIPGFGVGDLAVGFSHIVFGWQGAEQHINATATTRQGGLAAALTGYGSEVRHHELTRPPS